MIDLLPLATYIFVMSITPGPNNVMVTASGANHGLQRTLPHLLGISIGFMLQAVLVCFGLGAIFERIPVLQVALAWLGAGYLVYLGWRLAGAGAVGDARSMQPITFVEAALFQWVNPKAWMIAVTIAAMFMPRGTAAHAAALAIAPLLFVINFPSVLVWALFGSSLRRFLDSTVRRRCFNVAMAIALIGTAAVMLARPA